MELKNHFETSGQWLFRWRSYLPAVLLLPLIFAATDFERPWGRHDVQEFWELFCIAVTLLGLTVRVLVAGFVPGGTSGRNTKKQVADSLNTTGIYSVCRHPLYLGNFLVALGWAMFYHDGWLIAVFCMAFWLYYERIMMTEEAFLREKFGDEFRTWAAQTPAFIPQLRKWKKPELRFSVRTMIRREYLTFVGAMLVFVTLELLEHWHVEGQVALESFWPWLLALTGMTFLAVRLLHKCTRCLAEEGR